MDIQTLLLFSAASLALAVTPGPDMILVAARSAAQGRVAGIVTQFGVSAGSAFHAVLLAFGLSQLFLAVPFAYDFVRYLGATYLMYLAWHSFTRPGAFSPDVASQNQHSLFLIFRQGFISNVLNPKVAIFFLALFPQFIHPQAGAIAFQVFVLAGIFLAIDFAVHLIVIWLADSVRSIAVRGGKIVSWPRYLMGTVFAGLALRLMIPDRG